ncbi:octaprenyl-diphosphate synthase [Methylacidimicrobium cyclopophantes]|uniref:Octaprenyl-diphosphate synthase n=1 Tax=Methylacidimicrobium cyclopophantes TaxID=1041766 RepID=A0A5E6MJF5_9BACT|nr:polyprenyl synthetase family protein [Methylacidimicrobium cyclopophantes]VVM05642.1 octaprenyl-diphosphate synthase [Methylacidimicrobium cyclopophantes]
MVLKVSDQKWQEHVADRLGVVAAFLETLEEINREVLRQAEELDPWIRPYFHSLLASRGKRLRPLLVVLSASASGGVRPDHINLAVVVEMIHVATLVHDDILDGALLRRGEPTATSRWGTEVSVLLGDTLFAHALRICAKLPEGSVERVATAVCTVCSGEILQTQRRFDWGLREEEYFRIIERKTGELFRMPCEVSAWLNGVSDETSRALGRYGMALGIAYQIYDDCLDLLGKEEATGKTLGTDWGGGKPTLPILYLLDSKNGARRDELVDAFHRGSFTRRDDLWPLLAENGVLPKTQGKVVDILRSARSELDVLAPGDSKRALEEVVDLLGNQVERLIEEIPAGQSYQERAPNGPRKGEEVEKK